MPGEQPPFRPIENSPAGSSLPTSGEIKSAQTNSHLDRDVYQALSRLGNPTPEPTGERNPRFRFGDPLLGISSYARMRVARSDAPPPCRTAHGLTVDAYRSQWKLRPDHPITAPAIPSAARLWREVLARSARQGSTAARKPGSATATGATTKAEKLIGHGGIGSITMPEAGADSFLIYGLPQCWHIH